MNRKVPREGDRDAFLRDILSHLAKTTHRDRLLSCPNIRDRVFADLVGMLRPKDEGGQLGESSHGVWLVDVVARRFEVFSHVGVDASEAFHGQNVVSIPSIPVVSTFAPSTGAVVA